jgi:hypothetical protein
LHASANRWGKYKRFSLHLPTSSFGSQENLQEENLMAGIHRRMIRFIVNQQQGQVGHNLAPLQVILNVVDNAHGIE